MIGQRVTGAAAAPPVVIEGPGTLITGEQARYRVRPTGNSKIVSWAVGGGSVSQSPDPAHPDELLLTADGALGNFSSTSWRWSLRWPRCSAWSPLGCLYGRSARLS
jgi:hypothetical protein